MNTTLIDLLGFHVKDKSPSTNICIKDDHTFAATLLCTKSFQDIDTLSTI